MVFEPEILAGAIALHRQGQLDQAAVIYLGVLQADQRNVDALHFLGVLHHQQGRPLLGIDLVSRALALRPGYVDAHNNLGNIFDQIGARKDAADAYRRALALQADHPEATRNLERVLRRLDEVQESLEAHQRAIAQDPAADAGHRYEMAAAYKELGRMEEAIATLKEAVLVKPDPNGYRRLGEILCARGRIDEAVANYEAWLRVDPENPVPRHMLAACTLKDVPARAEEAYVSKLFDGFAESFDHVLHQLEYRAPGLVGEALRRIHGEPRAELEILDAGCGTGLLGGYLRPYARRLVGVDLSRKMLEKARQRAVYDELTAAELASYLRAAPEPFDLVASSDTLIYFGDLLEVFVAARTVLRPGGWLVFTVEHETDEAHARPGYRINPKGRYSHTEPYLRTKLGEAGFEAIEVQKGRLRREGPVYVDGLVVAARRASPIIDQ